jgi:hypothetical protein
MFRWVSPNIPARRTVRTQKRDNSVIDSVLRGCGDYGTSTLGYTEYATKLGSQG